MPFEFRQILQIPYIFRVKVSFLCYHLLTIQSQRCKFCHSFIWKFNPTLPKAYLLVASSFDTILSSPLAFWKQIYSFHIIAFEKLFDVAWFHIRRYSWHVTYSSIAQFLHVLSVFFLLLLCILIFNGLFLLFNFIVKFLLFFLLLFKLFFALLFIKLLFLRNITILFARTHKVEDYYNSS